MYLVDTNIISIIAPARQKSVGEQAIADWIAQTQAELYLSVIIAAEVEDGIAKARRNGATRKANGLAEWWGAIVHYYGDRILPIDLTVARAAGPMIDKARAAGLSPGCDDVAIAATAAVHGLTVLTRNVRDFAALEVPLLNPYETLP